MTSHICCVGFDPRLKDIPVCFHQSGMIKRTITDFFNVVLEATPEITSYKLNFAYFEQYGLEGMEALRECILMAKSVNKFLIADVKRGDIDLTNQAIIEGLTRSWYADAATFHPYLGRDTFAALKNTALRPYFLARTSNSSGAEIQALDLKKSKQPLFLQIMMHYLEHFPEGGFVVGGTDLVSLELILKMLTQTPAHPYLLIPGVGRQGANTSQLMECLKPHYKDLLTERVLVNVSSGIIYAAPADTRSIKEVSLLLKEATQRYIKQLTPEA
jgi:orotidine 5'-phosphate decarboxylase subfamily 2